MHALPGHICPLSVEQLSIVLGGTDRQVVNRPGLSPLLPAQAGSEQRRVERRGERPQVPAAVGLASWLEAVDAVPRGDQLRVGVRGAQTVLAGQTLPEQ